MTHPNMISEAIKPLIEDETVLVSNLLGKIESITEFKDRNTIKVVIDKFNNAIYMSREPIPTRCKSEKIQKYKQVCIIPFKRDFLIEYTKMSQTPLKSKTGTCYLKANLELHTNQNNRSANR